MNIEEIFCKRNIIKNNKDFFLPIIKDFAKAVNKSSNSYISEIIVIEKLSNLKTIAIGKETKEENDEVIIDELLPDKLKTYKVLECFIHKLLRTEVTENDEIKPREDLEGNVNHKLNEGITGCFIRRIWKEMYSEGTFPIHAENKYLGEIEVASILVDLLDKNQAFVDIMQNPSSLIERLEGINYGDMSLWDYLKVNMDEFAYKNDVFNSDSLLNCVEAIGMCGRQIASKRLVKR